MKIRPYSEQVSRQRIEDSVYHLYKKAQIVDNSAGIPQSPEDVMTNLLKMVCEKLGINCSDEEIKDAVSLVESIDIDFDISKITSELPNVADKITALYMNIKNDDEISSADQITEMDMEDAESLSDNMSKESYFKIKREIKKHAKLNKSAISIPTNPMAAAKMYLALAKQIIPKAKSTFGYFFKSDSSKAKKIFVFIACALATFGYIVSPLDIIPEGFTAALGATLGSVLPLLGTAIGGFIGALIGYTDDIVAFFFIVDYIAPMLDSNYIKSGTATDFNMDQPEDMPQLEDNPDMEEGVIIDVEATDITDVDKEAHYMLKELIKVANSLDLKGYNDLADQTDAIIKKLV